MLELDSLSYLKIIKEKIEPIFSCNQLLTSIDVLEQSTNKHIVLKTLLSFNVPQPIITPILILKFWEVKPTNTSNTNFWETIFEIIGDFHIELCHLLINHYNLPKQYQFDFQIIENKYEFILKKRK